MHPSVPDVELGESECAYYLLVFRARLICVYRMCNDDQNVKLILHNDMCQMNTELGLECAPILYIQHFNTLMLSLQSFGWADISMYTKDNI